MATRYSARVAMDACGGGRERETKCELERRVRKKIKTI